MPEQINIGTSGWSYKHWRGLYYPDSMKNKDWLPFYAQQFNITEINTSFYHLPKAETIKTWAGAVPKDFLFCPKMSRYLTHMKKLLDPEEPLKRFFDVFKTMKKHLGPILLQLPPMVKYDPVRTEHLYKLLHKTYKHHDFVLEVRHQSWLQQEPLDMMREYDVGFVISQSGVGFPYAETVTAKNIYVRFHGPEQLYASSYSDEQLEAFAGKFKNWAAAGRVVWAFFNNDIRGYAIINAARLKQLVK